MSAQQFDEQAHPREATGKFAAKDVADAAGGLDALSAALADQPPAWGQVAVAAGDEGPWGRAEDSWPVADGIATVFSERQRDGAWVSPERNAAIPEALRQDSGWYEGNASFVVKMTFPDEFASQSRTQGLVAGRRNDADYQYAHATSVVQRWYPFEYEAATGIEVPPENSPIKREELWRREHDSQQVSVQVYDDPESRVMMNAVTTWGGRPGDFGTDAERVYRVYRDEYEEAGPYGLVIDPSRHREVHQEPAEPRPRHHQAPDTTGLTEFAAARVGYDMRSRMGGPLNGGKTLAAILETDGVSGKTAEFRGSDTSPTYYLTQDGRIGRENRIKVSKATWDALDSVPDSRTPEEVEQVDVERATRALRRQPASTAADRAGVKRAGDGLRDARASLTPARDAARQKPKPRPSQPTGF